MKAITLTSSEAAGLAALAAFGFLVPNGIFVGCFLSDPGLLQAAFANPLALVFILEAFFLMFLFAWLIGRLGLRRPTGLGFIALSLVGSLAFSVPAAPWLALRNPSADDRRA